MELMQEKIGTFEKWVLYYLALGVIQALWTDSSTFPPTPFRIAMIVLVFGPTLYHCELILFAIPFSMTLRGYLSTGYSYLPDIYSYWLYIGIEVVALIIHRKRLNFSLCGKVRPLIVMMICFAIVDLIANGEIGKYAIHIFIGLLLIPHINEESDFHYISASLICVSLLLSVYYIIMYDRFLEAWGHTGLERSGWADPNYFSIVLDAGFFVAMMYLLNFCKSVSILFNKIVLVGACILIALAVILTASRAGFLCIAFILLIAIFTAGLTLPKFILALVVIAGASIYLYSNGFMNLLYYRLFEQGNLDTGGDRTTIWKIMIDNFYQQKLSLQMFGGGYWHRRELTTNDTHNEFLAILGDYGYVGLILFIAFLMSLTSKRKGYFWKNNASVCFYLLSIISLSPFAYVYIMFLILWIYAYNFFYDFIDICELNV